MCVPGRVLGELAFFFFKNTLLDYFDVSVLDDRSEGILWIQLKHKVDNLISFPCVCYLPPENSSRRTDVNLYFDTLLADIYKYQKLGNMFICGNFNSRCGDLDDHIWCRPY